MPPDEAPMTMMRCAISCDRTSFTAPTLHPMTNPAAGDAPSGSTRQGVGKPTLVVGVGASAGGVTALQQFFAHVRPDSSAAFVVILHLSPDHESRLAEVLQHATALPVTKVTEQVEVAGGRVYVISPKTSLAIENGWLTVAEIVRPEQRRAP